MSSLFDRCAFCGHEFEDKNEAVRAASRAWHEKCFTCVRCNKQLSPEKGQYVADSSAKAYCLDCDPAKGRANPRSFDPQQRSNVCPECLRPISAGSVTDNKGKQRHPKCWACKRCGKELRKEYKEIGKRVLCESCYYTEKAYS